VLSSSSLINIHFIWVKVLLFNLLFASSVTILRNRFAVVMGDGGFLDLLDWNHEVGVSLSDRLSFLILEDVTHLVLGVFLLV
tara:strand:- start:1471 stop:1716 length:246 start_codon:yes stop_codon:yes gene_type:complete